MNISSVSGTSPLEGLSRPLRVQAAPAQKSFGEFLASALNEVNKAQAEAGEKVTAFATGQDLDVHQVMIALEKASTALQLTTQVRSKALEGFQEIMHMPI